MADPPDGTGGRRRGWRAWLRIVYVVAVMVAFAVAVAARAEEIGAQLTRAEPLLLLGATVAGLAGVGLSGLVWRRMLAGLGSALPWRAAGRVFFLAQIGKYLPGSLWPVLAQAELGADHGVPRRAAVAGQTLFMWVHLVTGAAIGVPVLGLAGVLPRWVIPIGLASLALLHPAPLSVVMDWLLVRLGRQPLPARPAVTDMSVASGWAVMMWAAYGLHTYWLIDALEVPGPGLAPLIAATGAFAAAWSAGFLFLIAPAGAGAREVVLVAGLGAVTSSATAFTVALLSRLLLTIADGAWAAASAAVRGGRPPVGVAATASGVDADPQSGPGQRQSEVGDGPNG